jgi:hypothetical protein
MELHHNSINRLGVLVIAPEAPRGNVIVGDAQPSVSDSEYVDYAELLSACNYTFDICAPKDIAPDLFGDSESVKYSSIVLGVPLSELSERAVSLIRQISLELGVSLIAAYDHPDDRSAAWFGIERFTGKKMLWPLKANIMRWPNGDAPACVADYGPHSGLPGIRLRGFRKLSWKQTFTKARSLIRSLQLPYMTAARATDTEVLSTTMRGEVLAWSYQFGNATNYYFALHGDLFLDKYNEMHRLVRSALDANSGHGMVCADVDSTMVLRLDDPGASKAEYVEGGCLLTETEWNELGTVLEEVHAPLSVMYTPGWVDDGDHKSGNVFIDGEMLSARTPGALYDSARVKYVFFDSTKPPHDHVSEFRGLETLVNKRLVDIHSHGLTHLNPDHNAWAVAPDKRAAAPWYTEFYDSKNDKPVSTDDQARAMEQSKNKIQELFGAPAEVLTPSGHKHNSECDVLAHAAGYDLFSVDYTGIMKRGSLIRNWKIPALMLYFKEPTASIEKAGYPVIGVIHDYEIKLNLGRLRSIIDKWKAAGVKKYISLNSLAASLCSQIDAYYSVRESKIEVRIILPATTSHRHRTPRAAHVSLRIVLPRRCSYAKEAIDIAGGVLVCLIDSGPNAISMSIRPTDAESIDILIPVRRSQSGDGGDSFDSQGSNALLINQRMGK